jgi:methylphosphotriester-DNA--protein-cysteine methyltransferase
MTYDHNQLLEHICLTLAFSPNITLSQIASDLGITRQTLTAIVSSGKHMTFKKLKSEIRMEQFVSALTNRPNALLKEIAFELSFVSSNGLYKFTRKMTGMGPAQIRLHRNL